MKKKYESPSLEVVKFRYRDQVVATSGTKCINQYVHAGTDTCDNWEWVNNFNG